MSLPNWIQLEKLGDGRVSMSVKPGDHPDKVAEHDVIVAVDALNDQHFYLDTKAIAAALQSKAGRTCEVAYPKDAWFEVTFQEDENGEEMLATGTLHPAQGGQWPAPMEALEEIKRQGVKEGLKQEVVEEMLKREAIGEEQVIAEGRPMEPPVDGLLNTLFDKGHEEEQAEDEKGRVDYRDKSTISSVAAGDPVLEIIYPQPGKDGVTVRGKRLPAPKAKPLKIRLGKNTKFADDTKTLVLSEIEGVPALRPGIIEVNPLFEINGDVDFSVGNVQFHGTLHIRGNVLQGFHVQSTGDVLIDGMVDAANVESVGGSVTIRGGVAGHGKAVIQAKGDIRCHHVERAMLLSEANIIVEQSVMHSTLMAFGNITVTERRGQIIGGVSRCGGTLTVNDLGAVAHPTTEVQVGGNPKVQVEQANIQKALDGLMSAVDEQEKNVQTLEKQVAASKDEVSAEKKKEILEQSRQALKDTKQRVDDYMARLSMLENKLLGYEKHNPKVVVHNTAHPGVVLNIKNATYKILRETDHMQFVLTSEDEVGMQPL